MEINRVITLPAAVHRRIDVAFKFDALTSLRGIAALCTLFVHLVAVWAVAFPAISHWDRFHQFATHCYLFVDFFFILSGFVMSHVYGHRFREDVAISGFMKFMRARFARIYPLHLLVLAIYVGLAAVGVKQEQENPQWSIVANIFLVQAMGFFSHPTWNIPSWSISVEWWAYVLFPFVAAFAQRHFRTVAAVPVLVLNVGIFIVLSLHYGSADITVGVAFVRCLVGFLTGSCIYSIYLTRRDPKPIGMINNAALLAIFAGLTFLPSPFTDIFAFIGFCTLLYASCTNTNARDWLRHPLLVRIGDISYSIYLWHTLLLHVFAKVIMKLKAGQTWSDAEQVGYFIVALVFFEVCILLLAHLSYKLFELPMRNFINAKVAAPKREAAVSAIIHSSKDTA
jgi:peptidoglycan/LPS O-acetylase OafA/YrhL